MDKTQLDKYQKLGINICYYRKKRGLTQMQLAELLDIDRTHMGRIESAHVGISMDLLFRLVDVLDISLAQLFDFRD